MGSCLSGWLFNCTRARVHCDPPDRSHSLWPYRHQRHSWSAPDSAVRRAAGRSPGSRREQRHTDPSHRARSCRAAATCRRRRRARHARGAAQRSAACRAGGRGRGARGPAPVDPGAVAAATGIRANARARGVPKSTVAEAVSAGHIPLRLDASRRPGQASRRNRVRLIRRTHQLGPRLRRGPVTPTRLRSPY